MIGVRLALLADHPELVRQSGVLRWTEWGYDDPSPAEWIAVSEREAGRDELDYSERSDPIAVTVDRAEVVGFLEPSFAAKHEQ